MVSFCLKDKCWAWFRVKGEKVEIWHFSRADSCSQVMVYNPFMATVAWSDCLNSSECVWLERWVAEHFLFLETGALNLKKSSWLLPSYHVQLVLERHLTSYQLHLLQDQGAEVPAKTPAVPLKTFTPLTVMQVFALLAEGRIHVWVRDRLLWLGKIQLQSPQLNKHFLWFY